MYTVRKKIRVEYAHQLFTSYTNLCHETIHGHSGIIELFLACEGLDNDQMVIDFGKISNTIKNKIMEKYDHALFMPKSFPAEYLDTLKKYNKRNFHSLSSRIIAMEDVRAHNLYIAPVCKTKTVS